MNRNSICFLPLLTKTLIRSSHPEAFQGKDVLKICVKFTGEHPGRSAISIKDAALAAFFQNTFSSEHLWWAASDSFSKQFLNVIWNRFYTEDAHNFIMWIHISSCPWALF